MIDTSAYDALKSNFEALLLQCISKATKGEDWMSDYVLLRQTFNDGVNDRMRMLGIIQSLKAE